MLDEFLYRLHFAERAMKKTLFFMVFVLFLMFIIPKEFILFGQVHSLGMFQFGLSLIGLIGSLIILITTWVEDWQNRYY